MSCERARLRVGVEPEVKGGMTSVHQMGVCSELHRGHWEENETFPRLVLICSNKKYHHNITWHSEAVAVVMSHRPQQSFAVFFTGVNCDTIPNSEVHTWFP